MPALIRPWSSVPVPGSVMRPLPVSETQGVAASSAAARTAAPDRSKERMQNRPARDVEGKIMAAILRRDADATHDESFLGRNFEALDPLESGY